MVPGYTRVYTLIALLINLGSVPHWEEQQLLNKTPSIPHGERGFHNMGAGVFHNMGAAEVFYME